MDDEINNSINKIANLIFRMYLKDKRSGNIACSLPAKKKKGKSNALFD